MKSKIRGNAKIGHLLGKGDRFVVLEGFGYDDEEFHVRVFGGWITDGASVPRIFWSIFPPVAGKYLEAAILHDALYRVQETTRKTADLIFLRAMEGLKVGFLKRWIMYLAVRLFGWIKWNSYKKQKIDRGIAWISKK